MRSVQYKSITKIMVFMLLLVICGGGNEASADTFSTTEHQITSAPTYESTPVLGADSVGPLVVYASRAKTNGGYGNGVIYYQRLTADGAPDGAPVQVSDASKNCLLNDVDGHLIVYSEYSGVAGGAGSIKLFDIATGTSSVVASAGSLLEARIHGSTIVWVEGSTTILKYDTGLIGTGAPATVIFGPYHYAGAVEVSDRFIVWEACMRVDNVCPRDIYAYDLSTGAMSTVASDPDMDERLPATDGPWVVYQAGLPTSALSGIEAYNISTGARTTIIGTSATSANPTVSGPLVTFDSNMYGNYDTFVYRIDDAGLYQVTTDPSNQVLNNVYGSHVAYVDYRNGNTDIYVSKLDFVSQPLANAGQNQSVYTGTLVTLDGTGSTDPKGYLPLTYAWTMTSVPAGSSAALANPTWAIPTFTPDLPGMYEIELVVTNTMNAVSTPAKVAVNAMIVPDSHPDPFSFEARTGVDLSTPIASNAAVISGMNVSVLVSVVNGEYSINGGPFQTANGTITSGSTIAVRIMSEATYAATNTAQLTVGDVTVPFSVTTKNNTQPVANAGPNQTVHAGSVVPLDGSKSGDPDGDSITYAWTIQSKPSAASMAVLSDPAAVNPSFIADLPGTYVLELIVTDSFGAASAPSTVTISTTNTAPVAEAGPAQAVILAGTTVQLDGTQSYDPDGDTIAYQWTLTAPAGSGAALANADTATPSFVADTHGTYTAQLVVSDPWTSSAPDTVVVSFDNIKPVANAGTSLSTEVGQTVPLDGSGSTDANNDPMTYAWSFASKPNGSTAAIASATWVNTSFVPDLPGAYVVQLVVNDGQANSDPSTIQVQVVSSQTVAIEAAGTIQTIIASFTGAAFKNANMQNTLNNKLNSVIASINAGNYADAINQLQSDILGKTDGCATTGSPDKNDWLKSCAEQNLVYPQVMQLIEMLKKM